MELSIDSLKAAGGFSGALVETEIEILTNEGEPVKFTTWIRPLSYYDTVQRLKAVENSDDVLAYRIAAAVCYEDGTPVFMVSDVTGYDKEGAPIMVEDQKTGKMVERGGLSSDLLLALSTKISEVSGLGKRPNRKATRKRTSGTS